MNILFVHEVDWASKVVYDVHEFPELLSLRGHRVFFVDYEESYTRLHRSDVVRWRTRVVENTHRLYDGAALQLRTPGLVKLPILDRLSSILFQFVDIEKTIRRERIDVVMLYAMPTSGLSAILAARLNHVPVVFRAIDVLHLLRPQPTSSAIWCAERLGTPRVDAVVALTPRMKEYVCSLGVDPEHVTVVGTGIDSTLFYPGPRDPAIAREYGLEPEDRVAMFLGTMYGFSGLDYVIEHFGEVLELTPAAKLLLVGGGAELERFRALAARHGVSDRIVFTDMQPFARLPKLINAADIAFNSFRRSQLTDSVLPEKIPRYMSCGKPVLSTPLNAAKEILEGEANGVQFEDLGPAYMRGMARLLSDDARREQLGEAALAYARANHDWDALVSKAEAVLEDAIHRKQGRSQHAG